MGREDGERVAEVVRDGRGRGDGDVARTLGRGVADPAACARADAAAVLGDNVDSVPFTVGRASVGGADAVSSSLRASVALAAGTRVARMT